MIRMTAPSIFNDVIGPVMRGPSSSHCAAGVRIGRMARDLMDGELDAVRVEFDSTGALATTHKTQGSDMGLFGGFLGWDVEDERLKDASRAIREAEIDVSFKISTIDNAHPSTYRLNLKNSNQTHTMTAVSKGGGLIEVVEIDGVPLSMEGDYHETIIMLQASGDEVAQFLRTHITSEQINTLSPRGGIWIQVKSRDPIEQQFLKRLRSSFEIICVKQFAPVLPILSSHNRQLPFLSSDELEEYNKGRNLKLWELACVYECARGGLPEDEPFQRMQKIVEVMQESITRGLRGTQYADRILGFQSGRFQACLDDGKLLDAGMYNRMILYITAMMEAAPTAGACAGLPGACIGAAHTMDITSENLTRSFLAAGLIGVLIAAKTPFTAEVAGCQAECGAGSGMAAAALVALASGSVKQAVNAASMALQSTLGMICDPVAKRVEVPCLGKNVLAAGNALACANMALADFDAVIPLDEVIGTMDRVGRAIPRELRCTGLGGLSTTTTSQMIEKKLKRIGP